MAPRTCPIWSVLHSKHFFIIHKSTTTKGLNECADNQHDGDKIAKIGCVM